MTTLMGSRCSSFEDVKVPGYDGYTGTGQSKREFHGRDVAIIQMILEMETLLTSLFPQHTLASTVLFTPQ